MANAALQGVQALCCDVFGTVFDWRGSVARAVRDIAQARGLKVDPTRIADAWRRGYPLAMDRVRRGDLPWQPIDVLHRAILDEIAPKLGLATLGEEERAELNRVWHRLRPWPDARAGIRRLRQRYRVTTLSNGNLSLLVDLARNAGIDWDAPLSAELFHHYKPDPEVYLGAARLLDLRPEQVMMVAAHRSDLAAARALGLRTAYIERPLEYGRNRHPEPGPDPDADLSVAGFGALADALGL